MFVLECTWEPSLVHPHVIKLCLPWRHADDKMYQAFPLLSVENLGTRLLHVCKTCCGQHSELHSSTTRLTHLHECCEVKHRVASTCSSLVFHPLSLMRKGFWWHKPEFLVSPKTDSNNHRLSEQCLLNNVEARTSTSIISFKRNSIKFTLQHWQICNFTFM